MNKITKKYILKELYTEKSELYNLFLKVANSLSKDRGVVDDTYLKVLEHFRNDKIELKGNDKQRIVYFKIVINSYVKKELRKQWERTPEGYKTETGKDGINRLVSKNKVKYVDTSESDCEGVYSEWEKIENAALKSNASIYDAYNPSKKMEKIAFERAKKKLSKKELMVLECYLSGTTQYKIKNILKMGIPKFNTMLDEIKAKLYKEING